MNKNIEDKNQEHEKKNGRDVKPDK